MEALGAQRLETLSQLAHLRGVPLTALMDELRLGCDTARSSRTVVRLAPGDENVGGRGIGRAP